MRKFIYACTLFSLIGISKSHAQFDAVGDFFSGGKQDATVLLENYLAPWTNALGASLSGGWYNTAKPHKLGGFDLTVTTSVSLIPDEALLYDVSKLNLSTISNNPTTTPTVAGKNIDGAELVFTPNSNYPDASISTNLPGGTGVSFMPSPMIQLGIGLIKETEIVGRYMPTLNIGDFGNLGLWGVGIKHSVKQWIPAINKLPVLQLAVQGGYTKFNSGFDINITPETYNINSAGSGNYDNQELGLEVSSFTANILVGANLPIISFYGGLGFATNSTILELSGVIPVPTVDTNTGELTVMDIEDGVKLEMTNSDGSKTKPRMNAGFRLKFGVITLHADYTYANYSVATVGLGVSFR